MIFTQGLPSMISGPGVGRMYNKIMNQVADTVVTVNTSHPQYQSQVDELDKFRNSLRYGTMDELRSWYQMCSK